MGHAWKGEKGEGGIAAQYQYRRGASRPNRGTKSFAWWEGGEENGTGRIFRCLFPTALHDFPAIQQLFSALLPLGRDTGNQPNAEFALYIFKSFVKCETNSYCKQEGHNLCSGAIGDPRSIFHRAVHRAVLLIVCRMAMVHVQRTYIRIAGGEGRCCQPSFEGPCVLHRT